MELAFKTVNRAIKDRDIDGVILHSDQGGSYTSPKIQEFLKEKNIIQSMSQVGVCYDNVLGDIFVAKLQEEGNTPQDISSG